MTPLAIVMVAWLVIGLIVALVLGAVMLPPAHTDWQAYHERRGERFDKPVPKFRPNPRLVYPVYENPPGWVDHE